MRHDPVTVIKNRSLYFLSYHSFLVIIRYIATYLGMTMNERKCVKNATAVIMSTLSIVVLK